MFDYTQSVFSKTVDDLKRLAFLLTLSLQVFQIAYLIYALCVGLGILIANIVLLVLSIGYVGFMIYVHDNDISKTTKQLLKRVYKWGKRLIKLFTLSISIYGLCITAYETVTVKSLISIILLVFMLLAWVLELLFSLVITATEKRKSLFFDALKMDLEPALKTKNFFDKIRGREVEGEIVTAEAREVLTQLKDEHKEAVKQKRREQHAQMVAKKQAKKAEKAQAKAQKKAEKAAQKNGK